MSFTSDAQTSCFSGLFKWKFASKRQPVQIRHSSSTVGRDISHPSDGNGGEVLRFTLDLVINTDIDIATEMRLPESIM